MTSREQSPKVVALPVRRRPELSEFQPDAVEIEERPPSRLARLTVYVIAALIVAAVGWATVSEVDRIVVASGRLTTTAPNLVVQPLETSVIRSIAVKVGDIVQPGATLATLDPTFTQADLDQLQARLASQNAQIDRLTAEVAGDTYEIGQEPTKDMLLQVMLYRQRQAHLLADLRNLDERMARASAGIATIESDRQALSQRLEVIREIEAMRTTLVAKQTGSRLNLLEARNQRLDIEGRLAHLTNSLEESRHELAGIRAERQSLIETFRKGALEELVKLRGERDATAENLNKASLRQRMVTLTAPAEAMVLEMAQRSVGSVVKEAEPLFTLVPLNVPLEGDVAIDGKDIGHVAAGQTVRIKLDPLPFQKHGTARGILRTVSEDAVAREGTGDARSGSGPVHVYRARVELTDVRLRDVPATFRLLPGMRLNAEIKIGTRSVISYLLYPLLQGIDESIREP